MGSIFSPLREHAELKLAESFAESHGGLLPDDPFWRYVEKRFDQALKAGHLARFEHYHPHITPLLLHRLEAMHDHPLMVGVMPPILPETPVIPTPEVPVSSPPMVPVQVPPPEVPITGTPMQPPPIPTSVPEPASYLLLAGGFLFVLLWWLWERKRG